MRQVGSWLITASILVALVAGGLFSTVAWLYQSSDRPAAPTVAPASTPVPAINRPTAVQATATQAPAATMATAQTPAAFVPNVENGRQLFTRLCDSCHPGGGRGVGPSLRRAELKTEFADDAALKTIIRDGRRTMPAFRQLTDKDLNDLVAYIRTLD